MGYIPENTIQQVAAANDIVEVISSYFPLKRAGASWRALCPFHKEKSPSFHVNPSRQIFHCFGCGAGGTVIRFVMNYEGLDFPTAVRKLAQRAGIPLEEESLEERQARGERSRLLALHTLAAHWFHNNLMKEGHAAHARKYLAFRGLSKKIAVNWEIGYAPNSWNAFSEWALSQGYTRQELLRSGLVSSGKEASGFYDRFRNRLLFPIHNDFGEVVAFSGRTLNPSETAKYVNSPETPLFSKGCLLFGLNKSKRALIEAGEAIICEGQIDVISCWEAGIHNVVAPQGTAFTANQARLLKRYVESALLCFDSDTAGQQAIERALPLLLACELSVKIVRLPTGEDPDSLIRGAGPAAFRELISQATDYFDFVIDQASADGSLLSEAHRVALTRKLAGFLSHIKTLALREILSLKISTRLGISSDALRQLLKQMITPSDTTDHDITTHQQPLILDEGTKLLCRIALTCQETRSWLAKQNSPSPEELLPNAHVLHKIIRSDVALHEPQSFGRFLESLQPIESDMVLSWNLQNVPDSPLTVAMDCWRGILRNHLKAKQESVKARLRDVQMNTPERTFAQKEFLDLQQQLQDISRPFAA